MNLTRVGLATIAAFIAYFVVGGVLFVVPAFQAEFAKHPQVFRSGEMGGGVMAAGLLGILLAIVTATTIFARMHPADASVGAGVRYGALLALFVLGSFVLHSYMLLNLSWRLSALQGLAFSLEWFTVGVVIALVYRG